MVRTCELRKYFQDRKGIKKAVDGIDLVAHPGRIYGLLGINGAGKTTTLRVLSTILKPTSGTAEIAGFDVVEHPEKVRASIGFMSTSTALYGRLTAQEIIEYFGGLYGLSGERLRTRVSFVMEKLQIGEFADRLCDKLSTGQKQRVSIARTILHDPPVLFFDEPTAGLDVWMSQIVMEFIEEMRAKGKTVIFSTHIMSEVERLCDDVGVIHDGIIMASGSVPELKESTNERSLEKAFLKITEFQPGYEKVTA